MLNKPLWSKGGRQWRAHQKGVVLLIALIVLVAMTLAGIALVRSVDTGNVIAGNLAFQQAASSAGDAGIETAINWLENNNSGVTLHSSNTAVGYVAFVQNPAANQNWDNYWTTVLVPGGLVRTLAADSGGNVVAYSIQRLCNATGDPVNTGTGCAQAQSGGTTSGNSKGAGVVALLYNSQVYYRITSRIVGPRNTVSYVQAIVSM